MIESLFNEFDLIPKNCNEVTYAAMMAGRKNTDAKIDKEMEAKYSLEELAEARKELKEEAGKRETQDGLRHVGKTAENKRPVTTGVTATVVPQVGAPPKRQKTCHTCGCVGPHPGPSPKHKPLTGDALNWSRCQSLKRNK